MSAAFAAVATAMSNNPELAAKVLAAGNPAERAAVLKEAGVPVPTHDDVNSGYSDLTDVSGAGQTYTTVMQGAGISLAAASAVAAS